MGYNRKNILQRIVEIQDITIGHTRRGITQEWVYQNIIFPKYYISKATYYSYLAKPAKRLLREIEENEKNNPICGN